MLGVRGPQTETWRQGRALHLVFLQWVSQEETPVVLNNLDGTAWSQSVASVDSYTACSWSSGSSLNSERIERFFEF